MQVCSLGFIFDSTLEKVLLVHKNRPAWQAGKVNGVGGKVELPETALDCMVRECTEETSLKIPENQWKHIATIKEAGTEIEIYTTTYQGETSHAQQNDHEIIEWFPIDDLPENVITNLHFLVPLAKQKTLGHTSKQITINY